jgi:hypothetical protein
MNFSMHQIIISFVSGLKRKSGEKDKYLFNIYSKFFLWIYIRIQKMFKDTFLIILCHWLNLSSVQCPVSSVHSSWDAGKIRLDYLTIKGVYRLIYSTGSEVASVSFRRVKIAKRDRVNVFISFQQKYVSNPLKKQIRVDNKKNRTHITVRRSRHLA